MFPDTRQSPGPAPLRPPQPAWKGAWGGAWTVLYGCVMGFLGILSVASIDLIAIFARWGAAAVRANVPAEVSADSDVPVRLAALLEGAPEAFGASLRGWTWASVALAALAVLAGLGVIRRSGAARGVAIAAVVGSAVLSVACVVWWVVEILPGYQAWMTAFVTLFEELQQQGASGQTPDLVAMLPSREGQIVSQTMSQVFQLAVVIALTLRLCGPGTRAWCGASKQAIAPPADRG